MSGRVRLVADNTVASIPIPCDWGSSEPLWTCESKRQGAGGGKSCMRSTTMRWT